MSVAVNIQVVEQLDRGISYAESCFETFRVIHGAIFLWDKHWQRLQRGMQSFGFTLNDSAQETIQQQCLTTATNMGDDCLVRLSVSGGSAAWGLHATSKPQVYIQAMPFTAKEAIALTTVEYPFPLLPRPAKFASDYALTLRAMRFGKEKILLICKDGLIISGITANIALFANNKWVTPDGDGVLQGIIRQFFMDRHAITAAPCPTSILEQTKAAVLLNSGSLIQAISQIDKLTLDANHLAVQKLRQCLKKESGVQW